MLHSMMLAQQAHQLHPARCAVAIFSIEGYKIGMGDAVVDAAKLCMITDGNNGASVPSKHTQDSDVVPHKWPGPAAVERT